MYGRGSHAIHQVNQGFQPPRPPPHQQHVPNAFPPPAHSQTPAAAQSVLQPGGFVAGPAVPNLGAPFYAPRGGLPSTFRPPYVSMRQPVPIYGNMPMPSMYPNSEKNAGFASRGENRNAHHGLSPMLPPSPAIPAASSQQQSLPPTGTLPPPSLPPSLPLPPPPPHLQGPQIQLQTAARSSVLPPPPPPPLPPSSPPSLPPLPHSSLSILQVPMPHISSARLQPERDADLKNETTPTYEANRLESLRRVSDAQECRSRESNSKYVLQGSVESQLSPAPPQPKQKEIVKRIEVLCQFIAKNGSNFEDMARKRENGNPEFEFLFGGEPGSDAALAHDYFQWMKKKYLSADKSQEDGKFLTSRPLNVSFTTQNNNPTPLSSASLNADSDMEMEDDITPVDKDRVLKVPVEDLSEESDLVHDRNGTKRDSPLRPGFDQHLSMEEFSLEVLPQNEARSLGNLERAMRITVDEKSERSMKRDGPLRIVQKYASNDTSEDGLTALSPAPGSGNSESEQNLQSTVLGENENGAASLYMYKGPQKVSTGSQEARTKVEGLTITSSAGRITNEHSNQNLSEDVIKHEATSHAWLKKNEVGSGTDSKIHGPNSREKGDEKLFAVKVDEFGRLVREGVSDSESDDMNYLGRPKWRVRSRSRSRSRSPSRSMSPADRRRRRIPERRRDKRSRSRSWSPRMRRNRSRSPFFRRGNTRQDKVRKKECFNFRRGKCHWGAACRYSHHDADLGRLRHQRRRPHSPDMSLSWDNLAAEKAKEMPSGLPRRSDLENRSIQASKEVPLSSRDEKEMEPHIGSSQVYCSNIEGLASRETLDKPEEDVIHCLDRGADREVGIDGSNDQPTSIDGDSRGHTADNAHHSDKNFSGGSSPSVQSLSDPENTDRLPQLTDINHHTAPVPVNPPPVMHSVGTAGLPQLQSSNMVQPYSSYPPQPPLTGGALPYVLPGNQNRFPAPQNLNTGMVPSPQRLPSPQFNAVSPAGPVPPGMYLGPNMANSINFGGQPSMQQHPSHGQAYSHMGGFLPVPARPLVQPYRGELPSVLPKMQPYFHNQPPIPDSEYGRNFINPNAPKTSSSTYVPDSTDMKQPYGKFTNFVHHNPYASTFERPLISGFNSSSLGQVYPNTDRYSNTLPSTSCSANVEGVSRQVATLPHFTTAMHKSFAQSGVDQYDPLVDSVDPSSNSVHKAGDLQRNESAGDTDARMSGSNDPFEAKESNRRKEFEAFAPSTSIDDGFGETAEAEVGAVDNASLSGPMDPAIRNDVDFEIDQVKSPGKSKKWRESRSAKLFKISIANFVKELLRPSWRQGNMSKEAFKTIVKKTVDKVAGTMKGHRIPKSEAKINQYIDSSQRKLTKLVMGYVDKYVKV